MRNPFAHKPPRAKRPEPRRTKEVRLHGEEMTELRRQAFERSEGFCEATRQKRIPIGIRAQAIVDLRCNNSITWDSMELMHKQHGPRKSDTLDGVLAGCKECHRNEHAGGNGKPCPRKPGRVMSLRDGEAYWRGETCFCSGPKKSQETFCPNCRLELSPQTAEDIENTTGRDWCAAVAAGELEILAAQRVESAG